MVGGLVVVAIIGLAICICAAMGADSEQKEDQQKAKRPEIFSTLLGQEFPGFSADFTYSACQQFIKWMDGFASLGISKHLTFGGDVRRESARALGLDLAAQCGPIFSYKFEDYVRTYPEDSAIRLIRAFNAAKVMAKA